jgi:DNA polymerase (family 10)
MENVEIAQVLNEYAALLEIQNESRFRVRSYRQAARTVEGLSQPVARLLQEQTDLTALPGIGGRMAAHIQEIVKTGTLAAFEQTQKVVPRSLTELLELETLGPKKAKQLYEQLGITSIAALQEALETGAVEKLAGFGPTTVDRLRRAITEATGRARRLKLADADQLVEPLLAYLRHAPGIGQVEVAGSLRRRQETIGDIDILVTCDTPQPVMAHFVSYPQVQRAERVGTTRGTIILRSGLHVDLRIVPTRSYGAALHYFIGSKAHNVAVRTLGIQRGLRINEYGVFRVAKGRKADGGKAADKRIGGATEEDVFRAVGMDWVPPELREDRGEIQAAQHGGLPSLRTLVTVDDICGNLHMHSTWTDGADTIEAMARACQELGYEYCAMTDHSKSTRVAGGLTATDLKKQWKEIEKVRRQLQGITLLTGMEVDILPDGSLDLPDEILQELDIVLISVHSQLQMPAPRMTQRILKALAHPAVDILAHPTARLINKRAPIAVDLEAVFRAAKEHGVALEVNAQPDRLDLSDVQVQHAHELGVMLVINSDAHSVEGLRVMRYGIDQARRGWLEKTQVVNTLPWPQFHTWLQR